MTDPIAKHSVTISGHRTSLSVEAEFWELLQDIAARRRISLNQLVTEIDAGRTGNLSSAIRLYVLQDLLDRVDTPE
ncbi:MAG: ribbon-helix-helix domain-containing protein [Proteobacteria bacterium]|nr:ribbon-helix-helix domain-containing protein [Pseudomonadota bacterium]